jgi:hypothetical protein
MNNSLFWNVVIWFIATVSVAAAIFEYFNFKKKEARLSKACEFDDLEVRLQIKQNELVTLDNEASVARKVIGESEQKLAEATEARKWYTDQRDEITKLEGERKQQEFLRASIAGLKIEIVSLEETLSRVKHEQAAESANLTSLATQRANLATDVQSAKEHRQNLNSQIQEKILQVSITTNELGLKTADLERLNEQLAITAKVQEGAKLKLDETIVTIDLSKREVVEIETKRLLLNQECLRLKSEIDIFNECKDTANEELEKLTHHIQDKNLHIGILTNDFNLKKTDLDRLNELFATTTKLQDLAKLKLEDTVTAIDLAKRDLVEVEMNRHVAEQECLRFKSEIVSLNAFKETANEELEKLTHDIQDKNLYIGILTNDFNLKKTDLDRLNELFTTTTKLQDFAKLKLEDTVTAIDLAKRDLVEVEMNRHVAEQECLRLKSEIDSLNKWKDTLSVLLQRLQADIERIDPQAGGENRYRELWDPISFPNLPPSSESIPEKEALANTARYLRTHGLHYPQRVLNAFHTALKTAEMSPLVVLAGISGTGKSLLPKRYSEAMGIHMVSLAVQPRWDSPQDLLGFFNHLEGRFKATELARAMVMFEQFNRNEWAIPSGWKHGREDRMLLVLLDEMNLARVEYYFSDFLSRLETRRDVRESDPFDRAKAEFSLEMGSLREDEKPIRLYPGRNILFTGTMNEDESTQSLSDKVIDRACVLRFGRPKILDHPSKDPTPDSANPKGLSYAAWSRWCDTSLSPTELQTLNNWISKLNGGMDIIGKPFAHRGNNAILSYAANYPRQAGQDHLRLALADQIEQRIMPKLRGIELEDNEGGLEAIHKVLEETHDQALLAAFKNGIKSKTGTFLWRGLDRGEE